MPSYPTSGIAALPVKPYTTAAPLVTAQMSWKLWEMCLEATLPATVIPLPAGTYIVEAAIYSTPSAQAGPTATWSSGPVTLGAPGNITTGALNYRAYRNMDGVAQNVYGQINVFVQVAGVYKQYASTTIAYGAPVAVPVPVADAYDPAALLKIGSNVNVTYTGTGPYSPGAGWGTTCHAYIDSLAAAGGNIFRISIPWLFWQWNAGGLAANWQSLCDDIFPYADSKGIKTIVDLGLANTPPVANGGAGALVSGGFNSARQTFINAFLTRYASRLYGIIVHNEPNGGATPPVVSASIIASCTNDAWVSKQATAPGVKVLCTAIAYGDTTYLQQLYTAGILGKYDLIDIHPYNIIFPVSGDTNWGNPNVPWPETPQVAINPPDGPSHSLIGGCAIVKEVMVANGDTTNGIFCSEVGFATRGPDGLHVSEAEQGAMLTTVLRQAARIPYLKGLCTYRIYDLASEEQDATWGGWGWRRANGTNKPAFTAVQNTITGLKAGTA